MLDLSLVCVFGQEQGAEIREDDGCEGHAAWYILVYGLGTLGAGMEVSAAVEPA